MIKNKIFALIGFMVLGGIGQSFGMYSDKITHNKAVVKKFGIKTGANTWVYEKIGPNYVEFATLTERRTWTKTLSDLSNIVYPVDTLMQKVLLGESGGIEVAKFREKIRAEHAAYVRNKVLKWTAGIVLVTGAGYLWAYHPSKIIEFKDFVLVPGFVKISDFVKNLYTKNIK